MFKKLTEKMGIQAKIESQPSSVSGKETICILCDHRTEVSEMYLVHDYSFTGKLTSDIYFNVKDSDIPYKVGKLRGNYETLTREKEDLFVYQTDKGEKGKIVICGDCVAFDGLGFCEYPFDVNNYLYQEGVFNPLLKDSAGTAFNTLTGVLTCVSTSKELKEMLDEFYSMQFHFANAHERYKDFKNLPKDNKDVLCLLCSDCGRYFSARSLFDASGFRSEIACHEAVADKVCGEFDKLLEEMDEKMRKIFSEALDTLVRVKPGAPEIALFADKYQEETKSKVKVPKESKRAVEKIEGESLIIPDDIRAIIYDDKGNVVPRMRPDMGASRSTMLSELKGRLSEKKAAEVMASFDKMKKSFDSLEALNTVSEYSDPHSLAERVTALAECLVSMEDFSWHDTECAQEIDYHYGDSRIVELAFLTALSHKKRETVDDFVRTFKALNNLASDAPELAEFEELYQKFGEKRFSASRKARKSWEKLQDEADTESDEDNNAEEECEEIVSNDNEDGTGKSVYQSTKDCLTSVKEAFTLGLGLSKPEKTDNSEKKKKGGLFGKFF